MSSIAKKMMQAAAGAGGEALAIEDVFSTYLYTGNGSTQTITNNIDLAGEGGLVWIKQRSSSGQHMIFDTERGVGKTLFTNTVAGDSTYDPATQDLKSFEVDGFVVGEEWTGPTNRSGDTYASWTFRKAPRFFDVVTYTGNGTDGRTISHNLGIEPGFIVIKQRNNPRDWIAGHTSVRDGGTGDWQTGQLSSTNSFTGTNSVTSADDTTVTLGTGFGVNASGGTYVAYLFAHDPLGPSGNGSDGLIACGSYTGNGGFLDINLGWEPQWLLVKKASSTGNWRILDNMRGWVNSGGFVTNDQQLYPNLNDADTGFEVGHPTATGWQEQAETDTSETYIYIAIRRGPMRQPESGTEVFSVVNQNAGGVVSTGFPVDMTTLAFTGISENKYLLDRLRGTDIIRPLKTNTADAEFSQASASLKYDSNVGFIDTWLNSDFEAVYWNFRRAPGFFDVVAYTGDGVAGRTVPHNLGVAPEMMIVKARGTPNGFASDWLVFNSSFATPSENYIVLNLGFPQEAGGSTNPWGGAIPTESVFSVGVWEAVNWPSENYIAYLFATLPGVSKVGSYTGNGTSQTIDCGFTSGARFILIKRTDSTGDWYVWDTARGIVAGDDPFLELNTTDAEVTTDDSIDPDSSGFIVNQTATTNINVSSGEYIFYAVA